MIWMHLAYLLGAVLFILGIKKLASPKTARRGNLLAMIGMLLAVVVTLLYNRIVDWPTVITGLVIGTVIGAVAARKVEMTAMPQMVALFNGFGGGASALVALAEYYKVTGASPLSEPITILLSVLIGAVTLTGSLVAFARLQGIMSGAPTLFRGQHALNALFLLAIIGLGVMITMDPSRTDLLYGLIAISLLLGVTSTIPIGGADMPVVIALLNAYSGLAASSTGFVLRNNMLIISGALVGASGIILTLIMCKGMNRTLANVLFGGVGSDGGGPAGEKKHVSGASAEEAAMMLDAAQSVIIVPGYGLAVAQAQHALQELATLLQDRGCTVKYAIHPVAGRMPGHMNVLLAEANVPYDLLLEMDEINDDFRNTDVALVIGANDVINPAARYKKGSPLYGMPILNADQARTVMIVKRSLSPGFAGEDNELFYDPKTMMLFADAKKMVTDLIAALKEV